MTVGVVLGAYFVVYEINCIVMCMRPEMTMDSWFTKWNR